jgi:hypothetical protein
MFFYGFKQAAFRAIGSEQNARKTDSCEAGQCLKVSIYGILRESDRRKLILSNQLAWKWGCKKASKSPFSVHICCRY